MTDTSRTTTPQAQAPDEDLSGPAAVDKIKDLVSNGDSCFFCTLSIGRDLHARPMTVMEVDDAGRLWFFTEADSPKNIELDRDPRVTLFFKQGDNGGHLKLDGEATEVNDRDTIHRLWSPKLRAWFTEGEDDPRISLLRVDPTGGEYWDNRHGTAVAGIKMLFAALTAQRLDDGVHGHLRP